VTVCIHVRSILSSLFHGKSREISGRSQTLPGGWGRRCKDDIKQNTLVPLIQIKKCYFTCLIEYISTTGPRHNPRHNVLLFSFLFLNSVIATWQSINTLKGWYHEIFFAQINPLIPGQSRGPSRWFPASVGPPPFGSKVAYPCECKCETTVQQ
jgi:hypothetical protein